jgi:hypothetical protein
MKVKAALAAVAAGLLLTAGSCQSSESNGCEWELESVAYVAKPRPRINTVKPHKPAAKMPQVKPNKTPRMPTRAHKGKVWEYDCD